MNREDQQLLTLAGDLASFENVRGTVELLNCQENIKIRRLQLDYIRNEALTEHIQHELTTISHELQDQFKRECKKIDRESQDLIHKLEEEADRQRQQILDEIEKTHDRLRDAAERIESSQYILQREVPHISSTGKQMSEQVLRNRIKGLKETIENMASKRPRWQKIEDDLQKIQRKANRNSPTRKENPKFVMDIRRIATE